MNNNGTPCIQCNYYRRLMSRVPFFHNQISHFSIGEICVGEKVSHFTIFVIDVIKQVPLDVIIVIVSVAIDCCTVVIGDIPQLVGLEPKQISIK